MSTSLPSATQTPPGDAPATIPMNRLLQGPDPLGRFGSFGGRFVPETLMDALNQLAEAYEQAKADPGIPVPAERLPEALCRPALAAVPRRAADEAQAAGPRSTSSART